MIASPAPYGFRVLGDADGRRMVVDYREAEALYASADPSVRLELPGFLSVFSFPPSFLDHVRGNGGSTADYPGDVGVPAIRFDIDRPDDPDIALRDAHRLAIFLRDRYAVEPIVHLSGHKGVHVEVATGGFMGLSADNHAIAKVLACRLAGEVGIAIDEGVYNKVGLWRAPNSRHRKSGRYKVRLAPDDLPYLDAMRARLVAARPIRYELPPASHPPPPRLVADWDEAAGEVRERRGRVLRLGVADGRARSHVNPLTRTLIRGPTDIEEGHRHPTIFSAAADLAEFPTKEDLIVAILLEPGLDTGLPESEVAREIRCGIAEAGDGRRAGGGVA
jgi:hypothetical protein